jgi:hypothetical protein
MDNSKVVAEGARQHIINPVTDRCVRCGRNAFNRVVRFF